MRPALLETISRVLASRAFDEHLSALFGGLAALGFDKALYAFCNRDPETGEFYTLKPRNWSIPDQGFDTRYFGEGLDQKDPAFAYAMRNRKPFYWNSPHFLGQLDDDSRRINNVPKEFGWLDGYSAPLLSADPDHAGFVTLLHDRERDAQFVRRLRREEETVILLAHWFHAVMTVRFGGELVPHQAEVLSGEVRPLSSRECECLRWVAAGFASKEIAEKMKLSERTVNLHIGNAMGKLGARSRAQAVARAMALGVLQP